MDKKETEKNNYTEKTININGLTITALEQPQLIIIGKANDGENFNGLNIDITEKLKEYDKLCYITDLEALGYILGKLTLRASSLTYANLNDAAEKERVGVEKFASSRFITCFSNNSNENVGMWGLYGGKEKTNKILLKFENFAKNFSNAIHTDYCLIDNNKKLFFYSDEYTKTLKHNCVLGQKMGLPQLNIDYEIKTCVKSISMFDIKYIPADDPIFTEDYSGDAILTSPQNNELKVDLFKPSVLGKYKSIPWDSEKESRILCCLNDQSCNQYSYIDLRLKEEIFKNLTIIMSPWANDKIIKQIQDMIAYSKIKDEIKETIKIKYSQIRGTINM